MGSAESVGEPPSVAVVRAQFDAFDAGDVDAFVDGLTEDVEFRPPGFWIGSKVFHGREEVRASFAEVMEIRHDPTRTTQTRDRRFFVDRADEGKVLVLIEITVFEVDAGRSFGTEAAILHEVVGGKVARTETWGSLDEGISQLEDPVEVTVA